MLLNRSCKLKRPKKVNKTNVYRKYSMKNNIYILQCPPSWLKTPPLSLVYLENYLRSNGIEVKVKDLNIEIFKLMKPATKDWLSLNTDFEENLFNRAESLPLIKNLYREIESYQYVGFSLQKRNSAFSFSLARKIKEVFPSKQIVFGGPQAFFLDCQNRLDKDFFWIIGEGERSLVNILNNEAQEIQRFNEIKDIDSLPLLDFDCLDIKNYSNSLPILSSRGCKFSCNFCSERKLYSKFRQHSPKYVIDLMGQLRAKHETDTFVFCDSLINYSNDWLYEFCSGLIQKNLKVKWEAQMRVDKNFDTGLGKIMKDSGCYNLFIGLESASSSTLKNMNKGFDPETALGFFQKLKEAGLHFEISLIFGYPGESDREFKETLDFIIRNKNIIPKIAQANPFVDYMGNFPDEIFPGSKASERIKLFLRAIEAEKIKYTKSFINNLAY